MEMMQNAMMFQDAAPVALPQFGRGPASASPSTDGNGSFAELLQGKQPSQDGTATQSGPQEGEAQPSTSGQGVLLQLQNSYGSPASAAGGAQDSQQAATAGPAAAASEPTAEPGLLGDAPRSPAWQDPRLVATEAAQVQQAAGGSAAASGAAVTPDLAQGGGRWKNLGDIQRKSLAAAAFENSALTDAEQGKGVSLANAGEAKKAFLPDSAKAKESNRDDLGLMARKSLAAEAQEGAASTAAAQLGLAGVALATANESGVVKTSVNTEQGGFAPAGSAGQQGVGSSCATGAANVVHLANNAGADALAQAALGDAASAAAARVSDANGFLFARGQGSVAGTTSAVADQAAGQGHERIATVQKGPVMDSAALDKLRAANGAFPDSLQNAGNKGEAVRQTATGASEKEPTVPSASQGDLKDPAAAAPEQQSINADSAASTGASQPDAAQQASGENKGPHATLGVNGTYSAARGMTEQTSSKADTSVEEASSKTAVLDGGVKFAPFQGAAGQQGFGDPDKKGRSEQRAQAASDGAPTQPQGMGLQTATVAEAPQPEAVPVNLKSALHESILAQIKDGVVTHDDKGNGQMSIRLNPGELGELKIQVRMDDNRLHVEVQADNKTVKDLLMSNLDSLKESLSSKNLTMEGFDVSTGGGGFNSPLPEQKSSPRQQSLLRSARAGAYSDQGESTRVNYLTGEVNNLLDVRF